MFRVGSFVAAMVLFSTSLVLAQGGPSSWNRRISGVAVTPSPGAPAGQYDVHVAWETELLQTMSTFADLSTEFEVRVNGVPLDTETITLMADPGSGPSPTGSCFDCAGICGGTCGAGSGTDWDCVRDADCFPGGVQDCKCIGKPGGGIDPPILPLATAVSLQPGDEIMVLLRPAPGALPETEPSDDVRVITFSGQTVGWNRRILSVDILPSPVHLPDSFFDIWVDIDVAAINQSGQTLEIGTEVELLINGVPAGAQSPCLDWISAVAPCSGVECSGTCGSTGCSGSSGSATCQITGDLSVCACTSDPYSILFPAVIVEPDDVLVVTLRPVPGALPELPGFGDDDEEDCRPEDPTLVIRAGTPDVLSWDETAESYDVVRGDLATLRSSSGDFTPATQTCEGNDVASETLAVGADPDPGDAYWYVVRPKACGTQGSYDSAWPSQIGGRDFEISLSGQDCP